MTLPEHDTSWRAWLDTVSQGLVCGSGSRLRCSGELQLLWFPGQDLGEKVPLVFKMQWWPESQGTHVAVHTRYSLQKNAAQDTLVSAVRSHCVGASLRQLHQDTKKREVIVCDLMLCSRRTSLTRAESQRNL